MIKEIGKEEFQKEVLEKNKLVIVDFFAVWCGPCQMLSPVLKEIADEETNLDIIKIDVDKQRDLAMEYSIDAVPTMIIFKNGTEIDRIGGYYTKEDLKEELKNYM